MLSRRTSNDEQGNIICKNYNAIVKVNADLYATLSLILDKSSSFRGKKTQHMYKSLYHFKIFLKDFVKTSFTNTKIWGNSVIYFKHHN